MEATSRSGLHLVSVREMMKDLVYFDCDNTMGLPERDMDDGMALLYLLGQDQAQLAAVTTSFGNSKIEQVHKNTERMFRELHLEQIPLKKGAPSPHQRQSDASRYLAAEILRQKRKVKLLITGSPTNIYAACLEQPDILTSLDEMILMGGITEPLLLGGRQMRELNFSSDPEATHYLLNCPAKKTILSAQLCLQAFFDQEKMETARRLRHYPAFAYMQAPLRLWFEFIHRQYGLPGFHAWDLAAAVYLTTPGLFDRREVGITSGIEELNSGLLCVDPRYDGNRVNLPTQILDPESFWNVVFDAWKRVKI